MPLRFVCLICVFFSPLLSWLRACLRWRKPGRQSLTMRLQSDGWDIYKSCRRRPPHSRVSSSASNHCVTSCWLCALLLLLSLLRNIESPDQQEKLQLALVSRQFIIALV